MARHPARKLESEMYPMHLTNLGHVLGFWLYVALMQNGHLDRPSSSHPSALPPLERALTSLRSNEIQMLMKYHLSGSDSSNPPTPSYPEAKIRAQSSTPKLRAGAQDLPVIAVLERVNDEGRTNDRGSEEPWLSSGEWRCQLSSRIFEGRRVLSRVCIGEPAASDYLSV
jgi:hypothetical protein